MKVAVTGFSGFVGRQVLRELVGSGHEVVCVGRLSARERVDDIPGREQFEFREFDVLGGHSSAGVFDGVDAVIHLVGIISECGSSRFEAFHAKGTEKVVVAAKQGEVPRFLQMSALGVREGARSRYHQTKWTGECFVRDSGLLWTIFRPSMIFGPEDQAIRFFAAMSKWSPIIPAFGGGTNLIQPIAVEDVAKCFVAALDSEATIERTYDLCGDARMSFRSMIEEVLHACRRRRLIVSLPFSLAQVQAVFLEWLFDRCLGMRPPLNQDQLLMLQEDNVGDNQLAKRHLGLRPLEFKSGLQRYLP